MEMTTKKVNWKKVGIWTAVGVAIVAVAGIIIKKVRGKKNEQPEQPAEGKK